MGNIKFINAGAGSGKTTTLTVMFHECLKKGARPSEFILTTYTKAAADEFRSRIKAKLKEEDMNDVLPLVDSAHIGTIHSIAQSYIEKYWYLLDMSPSLSVLEEYEKVKFVNSFLESVADKNDLVFFHRYYKNMKVIDSNNRPYPDFWKSIVIELVEKIKLYGFEYEKLNLFKAASLEIVNEVFRKIDCKELDNCGAEIHNDFLNIKNANSRKAALRVWDEYFEVFLSDKTFENALNLASIIQEKKNAAWAEAISEEFTDQLDTFILSEASDRVKECVERIFKIAELLLGKIDDYKRAEGVLEFSDLEILFLKLLSDESVKADIRDSVRYVFVDEFQDVSPIQLKIFQALSDIVEDNCWVGDPKQAIYGFRGSDSSLVNSVLLSLKDKVEDLKISYRSLPTLVKTSNKLFANAFAMLTEDEKIHEDRVVLKPCDKKIAEEALYDDMAYRGVHHWWCEDGSAAKLYPAVAAKLSDIFSTNTFRVTDTVNDKPVLKDLKYGDVAILTKSNEKCIEIAEALRAKGLPVSVLDNSLNTQAEVRLLLGLMKYIAGIDAKLCLAELRKLLNDDDVGTILLAMSAKDECKDLKDLLDCLRLRYRHRSVYDTTKELVSSLDLRHLVCKWSMGQKRQANLDVIIGLAASFVQSKKKASVSQFIDYVYAQKIDVPFDNTGDTIKVLTYHKSKGLQWKMVILDSLHSDSLDESSLITKEFSKLSVRTSMDGNVAFNLFPPVNVVNRSVLSRVQASEKALDLWNYLKEKRRAEDLRLLYVGFTRAENYLVRLSYSDKESKWLSNTYLTFDIHQTRDTVYDNPDLNAKAAGVIRSLPTDHVVAKVVGDKKFVIPSQCKPDPASAVPACELERIAENIDVARDGIDKDVFGTCIHKYLAVHKWAPDCKHDEQNIKNAKRVLSGFGFEELIPAASLVKQADAFFAYIEKKYQKINALDQEMPFTNRKNGQVISGEIDLYVRTESGKCILADFKNPKMDQGEDEQSLKKIAMKYWPQLDMYRDALCLSGCSVDQICIYYPLLGVVAGFQ